MAGRGSLSWFRDNFFLTSSSIADWTAGAKIPDRPYSEQAWSSNIDQHPNIPADELIAGNASLSTAVAQAYTNIGKLA